MKTLKCYINESQTVELSEYLMIDEGLLAWIKKIWNKLFNSIEKNKKDHNGYYAPYDYFTNELDNEKCEFSSNGNSANGVIYKCNQISKTNLLKQIQDLKTEDDTNPFENAIKYCKNLQDNNDIVIFLSTVTKDRKPDFLNIIFGIKKEDKYVIDKVFWNECIKRFKQIAKSWKKQLFDGLLRSNISDELKIPSENVGPIEKAIE